MLLSMQYRGYTDSRQQQQQQQQQLESDIFDNWLIVWLILNEMRPKKSRNGLRGGLWCAIEFKCNKSYACILRHVVEEDDDDDDDDVKCLLVGIQAGLGSL